jgi:hypothetical protein
MGCVGRYTWRSGRSASMQHLRQVSLGSLLLRDGALFFINIDGLVYMFILFWLAMRCRMWTGPGGTAKELRNSINEAVSVPASPENSHYITGYSDKVRPVHGDVLFDFVAPMCALGTSCVR